MQLILPLMAALAVTLASVVAVCATERAASRISGPWGWSLAGLLSAAAVLLLRPVLATAEAVAVTTAGLMLAIPLLATGAGWWQRRGGADDRR